VLSRLRTPPEHGGRPSTVSDHRSVGTR